MSADWPIKKLSDVAEFLNSKRIPLKSLDRAKRQGEYPYYGASGIVDHIDDYIFDGTFLLISEDGENLRTRNTPIAFKAKGKFWVNNHAHILAEKEEGILDYLEYYFSKLDINPYITGAVQPKLNKANLDSIELPIPPKEERLVINKILNSFTHKIEVNRTANQTLEAIAQTLFKSWFVDFDPVKAKLSVLAAGGSAEEAERAAMSTISARDEASLNTLQTEQPEAYAELARTAALFPSAMQDSDLGEIPEGWNISRLQDCCIRVEAGGTPKRSEALYWGGNIKWLSSGEVRNPIVLDTKERITELGLQKSTAKLWPKHSTIVAMYGATAGQVCLISQEMAANQACCALIPKQNYSAYIFLSARRSIEDLASKASGSAQQNLNKSLVSEHRVINPAENILKNFEKSISSLISKWEKNIEESRALEYTRDTLLPKLLSGELTLSDTTSTKANPPESDMLNAGSVPAEVMV